MPPKHAIRSLTARSRLTQVCGFDLLEPRTLCSTTEFSETGVPLTWTHSGVRAFAPGVPTPQSEPDLPPYTLSLGESLMNLDDFRADPRFGALDGHGSTAVVIDSGIDRDHPFFGADVNRNSISDRIVYSYDFADNDTDASDHTGHGSNVSSIIGSSDSRYPGIAPGVNIISLKVFPDSGDNYFSYTELALRWVVNNARRYNVVTVNLSLGDTRNYSTPQHLWGISDELAALAGMNIIVTAAAGNDFSEFRSAQGLTYPAADPSVIAVGAVYTHEDGPARYVGGARAAQTGADRITPFSQRTTSIPMIFAPGAPITGASFDGGTITESGTSQAAPHVAGAAVLIQQLAERLFGARLTVAEFRSLMYRTAQTIVDGDDERDNVRNTGASFKRIDVFAMAAALWRRAGAEISLSMVTTAILDGSTTAISFGTSSVNTSIAKTFTIENTGAKMLRLSNLRVPAGFSIAAPFGDTSLAPNQTTTFTIQLDASSAGDCRGEVRFTTNDSDERRYNFNVTGAVRATSIKLDDGSSGFTTTGAWVLNRVGYSGDSRVIEPGNGRATAEWAFANLMPGRYRVWTTWKPDASLASNAPYTVDFGREIATSLVNQRRTPADLQESGIGWQSLGIFIVDDGRLIIGLNDAADGRVMADGVRIERVGNLPAEPRLYVSYGATGLRSDDRAQNFGSTPSGRTVTRTFTLRNAGNLPLVLDGTVELPDGFALAAPLPGAIPPGTSTNITLQVLAGAPRAYSGAVVIHTNDPTQPAYRLNVSATVAPVVRYLDDGDAGFNLGGDWTRVRQGYRSDAMISTPTSAGAQWTFTNLLTGVYRISATWLGGNTSASAAANFRFRLGDVLAGSATVDQRSNPTSERSANTWWQYLGEVRITGGLLNVQLSGLNGLLLADAIRLERIDN